MTPIRWDPLYELGITIIDEQHRRFVGMINALDESLSTGKVDAEISGIVLELTGYATVHFATEERYFDAFGCAGAIEHKAAHRSFLFRLDEAREKLKDNPRQTSLELLEYLHDWLTNHIVLMDKNYVACFKEHGLS